MSRLVMKFGGSSLATIDKIKDVARIVTDRSKSVDSIVVVVSAMGKTTNELIQNAEMISLVPSRREMDMLMSAGEQMSIAYLAMAIQERGTSALSLTGAQAGILTYGNHSKSKISAINLKRIESSFESCDVVVVAGFQGINDHGDITTLGRGGSDTSAVALACVLGCPVEIYTDVAGIYTVDPRLHPGARKLESLSYSETMEMANLGANIIEPRSVELAHKYGIPIHILLNTADTPGTIIQGESNMMEENVITNVSLMKEVVLINIEHTGMNVAQLFTTLAKEGISVDVISQTYENDISFTIMKQDSAQAIGIIERLGELNYHVKDDVSKISLIGNAMRNQPGVAAEIFEVFAKENIRFHQVSTSEISISYIIDSCDTQNIVSALASTFKL